jgi:hypothetical protein
VYSRSVKSKKFTFGVSGRLYKSNVLLYDHQTESLWSQLMETAVSGPQAGIRLQKLPARRMSWKAWKRQYPQTRVLSTETGYYRDYSIDPYEGYYRMGGLMFPVGDVRKDLAPKAQVLGIQINDQVRAYPLIELKKRSGIMEDRLGGELIRIEIDSEGQVVDVTDANNKTLPHVYAYWFAWQAFHRDTDVYRNSN